MATIATSIQLYDRVSAPINNMLGAINNILYAFDSVESSMDGAFDSSDIENARIQMQQATAQMISLGNEIEENERRQQEFTEEVRNSSGAADGLTRKIMGMVGAYASMQGVQKLVNLSDRAVQTTARLKLILDDEGSIEEFEDQIMASANRARASYQTTANAVAKLGMQAGKAFNNNTDEIIAFSELLNKSFVIAGTEAQGIDSVMLQMTQAMAAGKLQGEELNAILDNAQPIVANIQKYLEEVQNIDASNIKKLASEGVITANVIKNAMFYAAEDINNKFNSMPMTWSQVWTGITNKLYEVSQPILTIISWLADKWSILEPIVLGLATAVGIYTAALLINNAVQWVSNTAKVLGAIAAFAHGEMTEKEALATTKMTASQLAFNAALYSCPLVWILLIIIAVIAAIYAVVAAINKVTGKTISATGVIVGSIMAAVAFIYNLVIGLLNGIIQLVYGMFVEPFIGIVEWILNVCQGGFDSFGGAVANLIGQIISWFLSLGQVVTRIIDAIFGTNWTGGLEALKSKVIAWGKTEDAITLDRSTDSMMLQRWEYGDAYKTGYDWGSKFGSSVSDAFGTEDLLGDKNAANLAETAENTGKAADSLDIAAEDLKYLRDIAERDVINRFTTAEIKVDMQNNNTINSDMDLDGIVDHLATGVNEAMEKAAEGVHV